MDIQKTTIRRLAVASSLALLGAVGFASSARAGEGGIAGSAAFTINAGAITGVAVSTAVGKEAASAAAFNYEAGGGIQNAAWALGTAGTQDFSTIGDPAGLGVTTIEDSDRVTAQGNIFSAGTATVQLGTAAGEAVVEAP
jgi:hypothetical protein